MNSSQRRIARRARFKKFPILCTVARFVSPDIHMVVVEHGPRHVVTKDVDRPALIRWSRPHRIFIVKR